MFHYTIQVRMNGHWSDWVGRTTLSEARKAKRGLQQMKLNDDPWWDKVRIRPLF